MIHMGNSKRMMMIGPLKKLQFSCKGKKGKVNYLNIISLGNWNEDIIEEFMIGRI